jgi:glycosyltransferase involved in cell wall biosynthesis
MKPKVSIIVISYNMNRELPRTLLSLSVPFQKGITRDEFEVILIDNGSKVPPTASDFSHLDIDLRVVSMDNPTKSPVPAINFGLKQVSGEIIGVYIDGARIASPRLIASARDAITYNQRAFVGSRGRYLGNKFQRVAIVEGYNQQVEDEMLAQSGWESDGYKLFDISVFDESSGPTWFDPVAESNSLFMWRSLWNELGGYAEGFVTPGGGLVNLDTWKRACELPETVPTLLLGEATFHQVHGGVATNGSLDKVQEFYTEYFSIYGEEFDVPMPAIRFVGTFVSTPPQREMTEVFAQQTKAPKEVGPRKIRRAISARLSLNQRRMIKEFIRTIRLVCAFRIKEIKNEKEAAREITASEFFNRHWFEEQYPHVRLGQYDAATYYLRYGVSQRMQPSINFDAVWYIERYKDVAASGGNPLLHYIRHGQPEGRRIRALVVNPADDV